ncbi:MAG: F0F1 ATP synthase subunit epsilon [Rhodospirillales bacterium 70-18]|nr:F0F1 ATP synthase subunit epsilon [Rhodospirillales bacterium]OJY67311.1 MAG: F0F1 ATP synthase subunit epsilon [Rhodospirillales bacterium 70-18]
MSGGLHLTVTTPAEVLVDAQGVRAVRAEDDSGGFGILPGHTDLLTVLSASVLRWRDRDDTLRFCAVRGGVLRVSGGDSVAVACRQGTLGDDLETLAAGVVAMRAAETDAERRARVEQMRLHARAVRQLMRYLRPGEASPIPRETD